MSSNRKTKKLDMLNGPIWNKLPQYAIPVAATGILEQLFNASDLAIVGNFASTDRTVAIAAVLANAVSSLILFVKLTRSEKWVKIHIRELRIHKSSLVRILQIGLPAGIQSAVFNLANVVIQAAINSLGTVVIAASSAAYNLEILVYYTFNAFSQACTTFVGQNFGAGKIDRCKRTLALSLLEDFITSAAAVALVLGSGKFLLSLFNSDPQVIALGYTRLVIIFTAYLFSMLYDVMSGYLRGFGISFVPALLTTIGVCGTRIFWVYTVFPKHQNFHTLMMVYPVSLSITALLIFIALMVYRPAKHYETLQKTKKQNS